MTTRAWYLGATAADIAHRAILVGDPARVDLFTDQLNRVRVINEQRGLRTVTGHFGETPVTISAFGIGAPVAAIVLEELVECGAHVVLRAGTAMAVDAVPLGTFVVAHGAVRGESTSATYAPLGYPAVSDFLLTTRIVEALESVQASYRLGVLASFDSFYTEMMARDEQRHRRVLDSMVELRRLGVLAADMETSMLLVASAQLGVRAGSLCLVTVDSDTYQRMEGDARLSSERQLAELALRAICATPIDHAPE